MTLRCCGSSYQPIGPATVRRLPFSSLRARQNSGVAESRLPSRSLLEKVSAMGTAQADLPRAVSVRRTHGNDQTSLRLPNSLSCVSTNGANAEYLRPLSLL